MKPDIASIKSLKNKHLDEGLNELFPVESHTLQSWLDGVKNRDADELISLLNSNAVLNSPFQEETIEGASNILGALRGQTWLETARSGLKICEA